MALQLPESEKEGVANGRMTDKLPSSTSLWQILRRFESATVGGLGAQKNFTGRGVPSMDNGDYGAGRLYYETPVLQIMGREYSSLTELQKTLGQLGFNDGTVLLKLSFRTTSSPLEQAQKEIEDYFKSLDDDSRSDTQVGTLSRNLHFLPGLESYKTCRTAESSTESGMLTPSALLGSSRWSCRQ